MVDVEYNQNKPDALRTWPEFEKEMNFYIPVGVVLLELEDCSGYSTGIESRSFLHDETDFVSGNDCAASQTRAAFLCIGYDGKWAELSSGG
jgi:hypothetical protein